MIALRVSNLVAIVAAVMVMSTVTGAAIPAADLKGCNQCLIAPNCYGGCPEGQYCFIIQPKCHDCGFAECKPIGQ
ncbi:hypothetical protein CPC16_006937 [Podila verticillata]|nr:hypothetical protein BGZ52_009162 [Haplosporangium bisporale]KAF9206611.1 hypothetical protein BGZ59_011595 [Podila verticillata]KAF9387626.1 hypothetical protein CPC16_006937 [Podila verticillata]KAI9237079.1 MAG: hypothetical protein BYD32DRAFT_417172 [Podila humilis]